MRYATSAVTSADPTAVGITSTTSIPTSSSRRARARGSPPQEVGGLIPPGSGVPFGRDRGVEHVDVHGQEHGTLADRRDRALDDLADPELAEVVREYDVIPCSRYAGELYLARPVATQPDLDVPITGDVPVAHEPVHRRPVGVLDAEDFRARVCVGVEVDEAE